MKKSNRKGFTIVELVIVIAVIAILAAVLIPTFSNIIKKANVSSDTQIIRNANTALAADLTEHKTMTEALEAAEGYGLDISKINAKATGNEILWDSANDVFCYYNGSEIEYIPETTLTTTAKETELWEIIDVTSDTPTATVSGKQWSLYARSATVDAITVSTGFDAGDCTNFTSITYANPSTAQDVVIRTNSLDTELVVNAPLDVVRHYNEAKSVEIIAAANASYHEYGSVQFVDITKGRIVLEETSDVQIIYINNEAAKDANGNATFDADGNVNRVDAFDEVIIAKAANVTLPELARSEVTIGTNGTLVVEVQNDTNNNTNTQSDYIWLYKQGTLSQMAIVDTEISGITKSGDNFVDSGNSSTIVALGVKDETEQNKKVAAELANAYTGNQVAYTVDGVHAPEIDADGEIVLESGETIDDVVNAEQYDADELKNAVTRFAGGDGTENNPYLIATPNHWYNLCTLYNWGLDEYPGQYYISNTYFKLIADIDYSGYELPYSCSVYSIHLDGDGHTLSNVSGATLFDNDGNYLYNNNYFANIKIENCNVNYSLFGYGTKNAAGNSANFENVTVNNCSAQGGAFLYYCGSGTVTFKNCTATNTNVIGGYMASGGYVGNIGNGKITIDSCKFGGSVVSTQSICAGFVGQPTWDTSATNVKITNSEILSGTVIKNVADGFVAAFDGMNTSVDYAAVGNKFYGTLITNGTAYKEGTDAATAGYTAICTAADFTLNADGSVTYTGSENLGKVVVTQYVIDDYIYYDEYYGGYNWNIESTSVDNLTSGGTITGLAKITGLKNVVSSADIPVGLQTLDTTHVDEIYNGTFYFDAQTYSWGHYMLGGTYNSSTGSAIEPSSLNVYVKITIYDANGAFDTTIRGATLSYSVDLTK